MGIKIDFQKTYKERVDDRVNRRVLTISYSFIFLILTILIVANINPAKKDSDAVVAAKVLNIVSLNIRSGSREPLIYDLEYIVPALAKHDFTTADYYAANIYFKKNPKLIRYKNGHYSARLIR